MADPTDFALREISHSSSLCQELSSSTSNFHQYSDFFPGELHTKYERHGAASTAQRPWLGN